MADETTPQATDVDKLRADLAKADAEHDANCERVRQSANKRARLAAELEALEGE